MLPFGTVAIEDGGFRIHLPVVFASVLHHYHSQLVGRVGHTLHPEVERQRHLLMTHIGVNVGVGGEVEGQGHRLLRHAEVDCHHLALIPAVLIDMNPVVAAQAEAHAVVGYLEPVVGIGDGGVYRCVVVVDGVAVETFQPVAFEE